VDLKVFSIIIE